MEGYGYTYPPFPSMRPTDAHYPDHGDGFGEYYGLEPVEEDRERRRSRSKHRSRRTKRSHSRTDSVTKSRSRSRSDSRSKTRSRSPSRSRSRSVSRTTRHRELTYRAPGFLDAFRVLYLTPSNHKKNPSKFLATKKRQDRIHEILKSDELGSKKWLFYPRPRKNRSDPGGGLVPGSRDNCDQRVKIDGDFFRKYKKSRKVDADAPIAKLKRWELIFYKKLGFVQAV